MKCIFVVASLLILSTSLPCLSQIISPAVKAALLNPNVYYTSVDLKVIRLADSEYKEIGDTAIIKTESNKLRYKIIKEDEGGYTIIKLLPHVEFHEVNKSKPNGDQYKIYEIKYSDKEVLGAANASLHYYAVKKDGFKPMSKTLFSYKIYGVPLVHPIKLRPSTSHLDWDLSGEFTVTYSFGIRIKLFDNPFKDSYLSIVPAGLGVGAAKYFLVRPDGTLTEKADSCSVTYGNMGLLFTFNRVNFGVFTGRDAMISNKKDWAYQGSRWFSFGLGYKFKSDY
jgi:hypothetical protein